MKIAAIVYVAFILMLLAAIARAQPDLNAYKVTGINEKTKLRVCGDMSEIDKDGGLEGVVFDMFDKVKVHGVWAGKGRIKAIGVNGEMYELDVVTE